MTRWFWRLLTWLRPTRVYEIDSAYVALTHARAVRKERGR